MNLTERDNIHQLVELLKTIVFETDPSGEPGDADGQLAILRDKAKTLHGRLLHCSDGAEILTRELVDRQSPYAAGRGSFAAIAAALRALRPQDTIEADDMGAGMLAILITTPSGAIYVAGDAVDNWAADYYATAQDFQMGNVDAGCGAVQTTIDSRETNPELVADALHQGIINHIAGGAR